MRRSSVPSLPPQFAFPGGTFCCFVCNRLIKKLLGVVFNYLLRSSYDLSYGKCAVTRKMFDKMLRVS